ncbi:hypothetical protein AMR74_15635 [Halorubrum tropicale]|uniref:Uncharacterized protein n=1 Tax=Halorubrum tropicale TaxID=1765655 RepID=A0A0N0BQH3_9EURY|nr:hypothetical protein AMR74_15635 [Halorubrum tropicale]
MVKHRFRSFRKYGSFVLGYPRPVIADFDLYLLTYAGNNLNMWAVTVVVFGSVFDSVRKHRTNENIDSYVLIRTL